MKRKKKKSSRSFTFKKPEPANVFFFWFWLEKNPLKRLLSHQNSLQVVFFWSIIGKLTRLWQLLIPTASGSLLAPLSPLCARLGGAPWCDIHPSSPPTGSSPGSFPKPVTQSPPSVLPARRRRGMTVRADGRAEAPQTAAAVMNTEARLFHSHSVPPGASLCFCNSYPLAASDLLVHSPPCLMRFTPLPPPVLRFCPPSPTERGRQSRSSDESKTWMMEERENEGLSDVIEWLLYHSYSSPNLPQMFSDMAAPPCSLNAVRGAALR